MFSYCFFVKKTKDMKILKSWSREGFKEKFSKIKNLISPPIFEEYSAHNKNINKTYNEVKIIACIFRKKF